MRRRNDRSRVRVARARRSRTRRPGCPAANGAPTADARAAGTSTAELEVAPALLPEEIELPKPALAGTRPRRSPLTRAGAAGRHASEAGAARAAQEVTERGADPRVRLVAARGRAGRPLPAPAGRPGAAGELVMVVRLRPRNGCGPPHPLPSREPNAHSAAEARRPAAAAACRRPRSSTPPGPGDVADCVRRRHRGVRVERFDPEGVCKHHQCVPTGLPQQATLATRPSRSGRGRTLALEPQRARLKVADTVARDPRRDPR